MRRTLPLILLLVAGSAAALGLAEAFLRAREAVAPEPEPEPAPPEGVAVLRSVRELVRPDVDGFFRGTRYRTNHFGFRGPDIADRAAPGVVRVALVGDSFTAGVGVAEERTYAGRLREMFDAADPGRYEVVNLGVPGASLRASVTRFMQYGLPLQPQIVVYGFTLNDIEGPGYRTTRSDAATGDPPLRERCMVHAPLRVLRLVCAGWNTARNVLFPARDSYMGELRFNYLENPDAWGDFAKQLERLNSLGGRSGICSVLLVHEQLQGRKWPRPQREIFDRVVATAESLGFAISDSRAAFRNIAFDRVRHSTLDPHPNALGHEILAQTLHTSLTHLPKPCHQPPP
jgi:hypothetical protein